MHLSWGAEALLVRFFVISVLRFWAEFRRGAFPLATFVINLVGSFLIGVMSVLLPAAFPNSRLPLLFVSTGILGGFTTFSTFSLETFGLIEESRYLMAGVYAFGSLAVCLVGVCLGRMIARVMVGQS